MKIFISYAHDDVSHVLSVQQALDIHEVWFDQHLSIGQEWLDEIENQIAASHCFLFILSPRSMQSEYCQQELALALKLNKPIAPVMIEEMQIPKQFSLFQVIKITDGFTSGAITKLLNGLFEIEREVFNPLRPLRKGDKPKASFSISELYYVSTSQYKKRHYEQILNAKLQTAPIELKDIQHYDAGEVAISKVKEAYERLNTPVFVDLAALSICAWGGLPGGLTTAIIVPLGLSNLCKMLHPFDDKSAEAITVIAFTDGQLVRKFTGVLAGEIAREPSGNGYSWDRIFIPVGFTRTLSEMNEDEVLSISHRRRAMIQFMGFLQSNYDIRS